MPNRIEKEKRIAGIMIRLYCKRQGHYPVLCPECRALLEYACARLSRCPYGDGKGACKRCRTHCYRPEMRAEIRRVMRYAGPRMLLYAPGEVLRHWFSR